MHQAEAIALGRTHGDPIQLMASTHSVEGASNASVEVDTRIRPRSRSKLLKLRRAFTGSARREYRRFGCHSATYRLVTTSRKAKHCRSQVNTTGRCASLQLQSRRSNSCADHYPSVSGLPAAVSPRREVSCRQVEWWGRLNHSQVSHDLCEPVGEKVCQSVKS